MSHKRERIRLSESFAGYTLYVTRGDCCVAWKEIPSIQTLRGRKYFMLNGVRYDSLRAAASTWLAHRRRGHE